MKTNKTNLNTIMLPLLAAFTLVATPSRSATYTWDGECTGLTPNTPKVWANSTNWTGANVTVPTFNNTTDLIFYNTTGVTTPTLDHAIGTNLPIIMVRSLTFTADADVKTTIRPRSGVGNAQVPATLIFEADAGNASITIDADAKADHEIQGKAVSGAGGGGAIQLNSSLNIALNNTNILFIGQNGATAAAETIITGPGAINKSGPGFLELGGSSTFSGGLTITGGRVTLVTNLAAGTGNITLSGGTNVEIQLREAMTVTNAMVVSDTGDKKIIRFYNTAATYAGNINIQETTQDNFELQPGAISTLTVSGVISGIGGAGLRKAGGGIVILTANNTYTGETTVNNGTLRLVGTAAIPNTSKISIATGANFDVSGLSSTFTLGAGQTLEGNASGCNLTGNINAGSGSLRFPYNSTNQTPTITNLSGSFSVNNNTSAVFVVGSPLTNGSYKLTSGGAVTGTVASAPRVPVTGAGLVPGRMGTLSIVGGDLYLDVTTIPTPSSENLVVSNQGGTNLVLSWTQWQFSLQSQTNDLSAGMTDNWVTRSLTSPVTIPIVRTNPAVFFRLFFTNYP